MRGKKMTSEAGWELIGAAGGCYLAIIVIIGAFVLYARIKSKKKIPIMMAVEGLLIMGVLFGSLMVAAMGTLPFFLAVIGSGELISYLLLRKWNRKWDC